MMLGRIIPGRLPTTQANLDLINARIRKVQFDMTVLDNKVTAGTIDSRQAGYQKQQLIGEVGELRRVIANSRLSSPSYRVPSDIRSGKPAKKYVSYDDSRAFMSNYDGPSRVNKMPSDWQATELSELDVPDIPKQAGSGATWPSHWPGMHSPMIMLAVMQTGEVDGIQLIDPRTKDMRLKLNMVNSNRHLQTGIMLKARYTEMYTKIADDPRFTNTDRTLVNLIMGKINRQISDAEKQIETNKATGAHKDLADEQVGSPRIILTIDGWTVYVSDITDLDTKRVLRQEWFAQHPAKYGQAPQGPNGEYQSVPAQNMLKAAIDKRIADYDAKFSSGAKYVHPQSNAHGALMLRAPQSTPYKTITVYGKQWSKGRLKWNYYFFYDNKLYISDIGVTKELTTTQLDATVSRHKKVILNGQNNEYAKNGHPLVYQSQDGMNWSGDKVEYESLGGYGRTPRMARRNGSLMGFGAMQSHDRLRNMTPEQRVISRTQRQSYLAAERQLSMAKARAGARVDITQELKNAPVTRPWSMQVAMPVNGVEEIHMQLDSALSTIGLSQGMFTQQAHNYVAQLINTLDSSMRPSDRTEFVVEKIMSEMVNRSALLKDNVRVDVRRNGWPPVNITPADTTSVDGLGSAFLKTKAAMGRLLG